MKPTLTPLRYPGSKTRLLNYVERFLEKNEIFASEIIEPFAGTASISFGLLDKKLIESSTICEKDPMISSFWQAMKYSPDELIEGIRNINIDLETWHELKKYMLEDAPQKYGNVDIGLAFLFYNRTNYSGIVKGGPLGGKQQQSKYKLGCRFNKTQIIEKIEKLVPLLENVEIVNSDGLGLLSEYASKGPDDTKFFYIDPPYFNGGKTLYRYYFEKKEHIKLANILLDFHPPWLLSYDRSDFIKSLYSGYTESPIYMDYQANFLKRREKELLFSNKVIPPPTTSVNFKYIPELSFRIDSYPETA